MNNGLPRADRSDAAQQLLERSMNRELRVMRTSIRSLTEVNLVHADALRSLAAAIAANHDPAMAEQLLLAMAADLESHTDQVRAQRLGVDLSTEDRPSLIRRILAGRGTPGAGGITALKPAARDTE